MADSREGRTLRALADRGALVAGVGTVFLLPFLRQSYHRVMADVLGITNTELGLLSSTYGLVALLGYVPGGWLADRVPPRPLLAGALFATGITGLYAATLPSLAVLVVIHALWGVTTILIFWSAAVRAARLRAGARSQAAYFGILVGGSTLVEALVEGGSILVFSRFESRAAALSSVYVVCSLAALLAGGAVLLFLRPSGEEAAADRAGSGVRSAAAAVSVFRLRSVWLVGVVVLAAYTALWGCLDLSAFAADAFGASDVHAASFGTMRMVLRPVGAVAGGVAADRLGGPRLLTFAFVAVALAFALLAALPSCSAGPVGLWAGALLVAAGVAVVNGFYFSLLEDAGVPAASTGAAVGLASLVGYTPDIWAPLLNGWLLDASPGAAGHQLFFLAIAAVCLVGAAAAKAVRRAR